MGHVRYMYTLQREMVKAGHDFSVFALSYTLAPGGVYPLQLKQAALALKHLIEEENRDPSTVSKDDSDSRLWLRKMLFSPRFLKELS